MPEPGLPPAAPIAAEEPAGIAAVRAELASVRAALAQMEVALDRLAADPEPARTPRARARPDRYYLVLLGIYERGRQGVSPEEFGALGARHGYDRRGLGGYFVGGRASLRRDGEQIFLTSAGLDLIDEFLQGAA